MKEKNVTNLKELARDVSVCMAELTRKLAEYMVAQAVVMDAFSETSDTIDTIKEVLIGGSSAAVDSEPEEAPVSKKKTAKTAKKAVKEVEEDEDDEPVAAESVPNPESAGNDGSKVTGKKYASFKEGDAGKPGAPKFGDDDFREADIHVLDKKYLSSLAYQDLMYYGEEFDVSNAKYKNLTDRREHLVELIWEYIENELEKEEAEKAAKQKKSASSNKKTAKKATVVVEEEPEDEPDDTSEDADEDELLHDRILAAVEDMTTEEIADVLADAGISPRGKRQSLIEKLFTAVKEGKIEWDDEDSDSDSEPEENVSEDPDLPEENEVEDEYGTNDYDNPEMPAERKKALMAFEKDVKKKVKSKSLTAVKMKKALIEFYPEDEDEINDLSVDELVEAYVNMKQYFIDDEGDTYGDSEAYYVNGVPYCCGAVLEEQKDGTFKCPVCGESYEV